MKTFSLIKNINKRQLALVLFILIIGLISIFVNLYFPALFREEAEESLREKMHTIVEMTSINVSSALYFDDIQNIGAMLHATAGDKDIAAIAVYDINTELKDTLVNNLDFQYNFPKRLNVLENPDTNRYWIIIDSIHFAEASDLPSIGSLVAFVSLDRLENHVAESRKIVLIISLSIFFFGVISIYWLSSFFIKPLSVLLDTFSRIAKGDFSIRADFNQKDEFGRMAKSFNIMVDKLEAAHHKLESLNENLEKQVEERTKDLTKEIHDRKAAEKKIKQNEEHWRNIFENAPVGIYRSTPDGRMILANPAMLKITGYSTLEEIQSIDIASEFYMFPEERAVFKKTIEKVGKVMGNEVKWKKRDGSIILLNENARLIRDEDSEPLYYEGIVEDITDRKEAEQKIKVLNLELEKRVKNRTAQLNTALENLHGAKEELSRSLEKERELNELKSRFIAMISHEYRTPLTIILTSTYIIEQLGKEVSDPMFLKNIEKIRITIDSMTKLLDDVLVIGDTVNETMSFTPIYFNIYDLTLNVVQEIEALDNNKHQFEILNKSDSSQIISDQKHIRRIIYNMLTNAVKYSPEQSLIKIFLKKRDTEFVINVRDNGIGIPAEDIKRIFKPFYRAENVGAAPGIGLGMTIIKRAAETLGGTISINSELNKGTEFRLVFPLSTEDDMKGE